MNNKIAQSKYDKHLNKDDDAEEDIDKAKSDEDATVLEENKEDKDAKKKNDDGIIVG